MRSALILAALTLASPACLPIAHAADDRITECGPPPRAIPVPIAVSERGHTRIDEFAWLRDLQDPNVKAYLAAENDYARCHLAALKPLTDEILAELRSRVGVEENRPPFADGSYIYQVRYGAGANYPTIVRWKKEGGERQLVLDVPAMAAAHSYYGLNEWRVSPDGQKVAFAVDLTGSRRNHLFIRDIATGAIDDLGIENAGPDLAFSADGQTLFYVRREPTNLRAYQVWRRDLAASSDVLVYTEPDPRAEVSVYQSKSRRFVFIKTEREDMTEVRFVPADRPRGDFQIIAQRSEGIRYFADHVNDQFFIRTNLGAPDYRLMIAAEDRPDVWQEIVPEQPGRYMRAFAAFGGFVAIEQVHEANQSVRVFRLSNLKEMSIPLRDDAAVTELDTDGNRDPNSTSVRVRFSRLNEAERAYDFDVTSGKLALLPERHTTDWLIPDRYAVERIQATAPDEKHVPVTLIYRKDLRQPDGNPTVLYGYGAYGDSTLPDFDSTLFGLLDRGFVYAIAHVRGGRERGERWYVEGRHLRKRNSFADFVAAAEALIRDHYAAPHALFAQGASAGGLLVAASAEMRPPLFAGIVAEVPFVDVVTTASDPSVPLSTLEYREWGNPGVAQDYDYMLTYSPYDNVASKPYPAMLVTGALYDTQVTVREPAKWVARLRASKTDGRQLLFRIDMTAGHQGPSGRLGTLRDAAEIQAWLLTQAGLAASAPAERRGR